MYVKSITGMNGPENFSIHDHEINSMSCPHLLSTILDFATPSDKLRSQKSWISFRIVRALLNAGRTRDQFNVRPVVFYAHGKDNLGLAESFNAYINQAERSGRMRVSHCPTGSDLTAICMRGP